MGKSIYNSYISDRGLVTIRQKELLSLTSKKTKNITKKWAKDMNRHVFKEDIWIVKKHKKRCSTWMIFGKCKSKPQGTTSNPLRWLEVSKRKKIFKENSKCWQECRKIGMLLHCANEGKMVQSLWKTIWQLLGKLNTKLLYYHTIQQFPSTFLPKELD